MANVCKCMSASVGNRPSDILFLRYDLIRCKPENGRSASAELTGRVQTIVSKTRMLGYTDPPQQILHTRLDFAVAVKWVSTVSKSIAIPLTGKEERTV